MCIIHEYFVIDLLRIVFENIQIENVIKKLNMLHISTRFKLYFNHLMM